MVVSMAAGLSAQASAANFKDVRADAWFYSYVDDVSNKGLMTGTTETTFNPYGILTRGQTATILYRMAGSPSVSYTAVFSDVKEGKFYTEPVIWASEAGVITGYDNGSFGPTKNCTREQFATMLYRYAKAFDYDTATDVSLKGFSDYKKVSSFAETALKWAVEKGIIMGKGDAVKRLDPQGSITRAEAATMIDRFTDIKNNPETSTCEDNAHTWEAVYTTVHHDAVMGQKLVEAQDAWDETVTDENTYHYFCSACGLDLVEAYQDGPAWSREEDEESYAHFVTDGGHRICHAVTTVIHHDAVEEHYEDYVITEAYDEQVIDHYECSVCHVTKAAE